jgi:hypothetical protein
MYQIAKDFRPPSASRKAGEKASEMVHGLTEIALARTSQRDLRLLKQVDLEDRKSACLAESACLAFTYNAETRGAA